jgi:hypothetical protein
MKLRHVGTLVLAFGLAVCVPASAFAGNGNGKDNGNSANAPGQVKKEEAAAAAAAEQTAQSQVTTTAVVDQPAADVAQTGVKPSNDTDKDTHAQAASDKTKEYGNGKTAGQIAIQNGAAPTTTLHGPGNSQPHKASPCAGGHEVDVHALKGKRNGSCGSSHPTPTPTPTPQPNPVPDPGPKPKDPVPAAPSSPSLSTPSVSPAGTAGAPAVTTASPSKEHRGSGKGSVPGSTGAVAARTTLPFTGVDLWSAVFVGVMLILIGLALCRRAATIPVYESDQEARP